MERRREERIAGSQWIAVGCSVLTVEGCGHCYTSPAPGPDLLMNENLQSLLLQQKGKADSEAVVPHKAADYSPLH